MAFHLLGLKCSACGSYNTRRMGLQTTDGAPLEDAGRLGRLDLGTGGSGGGDGGGAAGAGGPLGPGGGPVPNFVENLLAAMWPPGGAGGEGGEEEDEWASGEEVRGHELGSRACWMALDAFRL